MNDRADITLVTPCRNAAATLDETIWSIVSQGGPISIRYHVQDGASTDGTQDKLAAWQERLDAHGACLPARVKFSWSSEPDAGLYDAVDKAVRSLDIAPDSFMGWLNAGDLLWPGALEAVARLGKERPDVHWLMGRPTVADRHGAFQSMHTGTLLPQPVLAAGLADGIHWSFIQQESTFWRKGLYDKAGGLDTTFRQAGDWDLWRRFARFAPLVHVIRPLGAFRRHPGQLSEDLTVYRAEMETVMPITKRRRRHRALTAQAADELRVITAIQENDGTWGLYHQPFSRADLEREGTSPAWSYQLTLDPSRRLTAPLFAAGFRPDDFTYGRNSHFRQLAETYITGLTGPLDIHLCDLKAFQDALCSAFIDQALPERAAILEVGGGHSRVLPLYHRRHECWNIDGLEGVGNGVHDLPPVPYTLIRDYMGSFSPQLPDNHFDLVFSLSVLEHVPENEQSFANILADIQRVLKPGGWSFHLIDTVRTQPAVTAQKAVWWENGIVDYLFRHVPTLNARLDAEHYGDDVYTMSPQAYELLWKPVTKRSYEDFGQAGFITVCWRKPTA